MDVNTDNFDFCPILKELLEKKTFEGTSGKVTKDILVSTNNNLLTLRNLHMALKPMRTLEIGLCYGGSCLVFTASHKDLGHSPAGQHTAIDPFQARDWDNVGLRVTESAGLSGYLEFHEDFSNLALPKLLASNQRFDLVYIDGSHIFEHVFIDLYYVTRLLSPGGVVTLDDSTDPQVAKVIKFAKNNLKGILTPFDLSDFRADRGKSLKYRMARALGKSQMTAFRKEEKTEREWNASFVNF